MDWQAVEAIGTVLGALFSGSAVLIATVSIVISIIAAKRTLDETGRTIRVQLTPIVVPVGRIHLKAASNDFRYPQLTLQNQGKGPALSIKLWLVLSGELREAELTSLAPDNKSDMLEPKISHASGRPEELLRIEYKDCLGRDYVVTGHLTSEGVEWLRVESLALDFPDFR